MPLSVIVVYKIKIVVIIVVLSLNDCVLKGLER